jgi:hypothetical protein
MQRRVEAVYCDRRRKGRDITGERNPMGMFSMFISNSLMMAFFEMPKHVEVH